MNLLNRLEKLSKTMKGIFIALEGMDGSGKDTQVESLKRLFREEGEVRVEDGQEVYSWRGRDFVFAQVLDENFPETSELRQVLFGKGNRFDTWAEIFIFWADKLQTMHKRILPNLDCGRVVVVNRWEVSQMVYQVHGKKREDLREISLAMRDRLDNLAKPDMYVLLDISPEVSRQRTTVRAESEGKNNFFDDERLDFLLRLRSGYLEELQKYNHVVINAENSKQEVFADLLKVVCGKVVLSVGIEPTLTA